MTESEIKLISISFNLKWIWSAVLVFSRLLIISNLLANSTNYTIYIRRHP